MMSTETFNPGFKKASIDALASVQCRPFRFFKNDIIEFPLEPAIMSRSAEIDGRPFEQFFTQVFVNGSPVLVPINALIRLPYPGSEAERVLMSYPINERLVRSTNAMEAILSLRGKSMIIDGFVEETREVPYKGEQTALRHFSYPILIDRIA